MGSTVALPTVGADPVAEALDALLVEGDVGLGVQLSVVGPGGRRDWARGVDSRGRPMTPATLHPGYCSTKPVLPLAVGALITDGLLGLDADIGDPSIAAGPVTVAEILTHARAELASPNLTEWRMADPVQRAELWAEGGAAGRHHRGVAYSEVVGWMLLERAIEGATRCSALEVVEERVLEPLALGADIVLDPVRLAADGDAGLLAVPVGGLPVAAVPLLTEATGPALADCGPALGGFVTARGLAGLCHGAFAVDAPAGVGAAWRAIRPAVRPPQPDLTLRLHAGFQGGAMTDLDGYGIDQRLAAGAVGHVAAIIQAFAFHAPGAGVSVAVVGNGLASSADDLRLVRRLLSRLVADHLVPA